MLIRYLKLFIYQFKYAVIASTVYRGDFILWFIVDIAWGFVTIIFFTALYSKINLLGGWNYYQILLLLGWLRYFNAFCWGYLWPNIIHLPRLVNRGELDLYLTKPLDSQYFVSTRHVSVNQISSFMLGTVLIIYAGQHLYLNFSIINLTLILFNLMAGIILLYSMWFITVTIVFYFDRLDNIINLFPEIFGIAQFPKTAFPVILQAIITFVIPVGIIAYTPAQIVMGRAQWWEVGLPVVLAGIFLYLSHRFWNFALKSYSSASS